MGYFIGKYAAKLSILKWSTYWLADPLNFMKEESSKKNILQNSLKLILLPLRLCCKRKMRWKRTSCDSCYICIHHCVGNNNVRACVNNEYQLADVLVAAVITYILNNLYYSLSTGIRQLQLILFKVALILGVEIHVNLEFVKVLEPPEDQENQSTVSHNVVLYTITSFYVRP